MRGAFAMPHRELRSFSNQSTMPSIATSSAASTATDATGHSVSSSTLGSTLDAVPEDVAVATGKVMGRADGLLLYAEQVVLALQEGRLVSGGLQLGQCCRLQSAPSFAHRPSLALRRHWIPWSSFLLGLLVYFKEPCSSKCLMPRSTGPWLDR